MNRNDDSPAHEEVLAAVVDELCSEAIAAAGSRWGGRLVLPSRESVLACMEGIRQVFFPGYFGATDLHDKSLHYYVGATLDRVLHELEEQVTRAVAFAEGHDFATCDHCAWLASTATRAVLAATVSTSSVAPRPASSPYSSELSPMPRSSRSSTQSDG